MAAGAIARKVLAQLFGKVAVRGALVAMGTQTIERKRWNWDEVARNPFFCPDPKAVAPWTEYLEALRKKGSSCGALIEVVADGIPAGLGAPIYGKLDADLASALMSINAVKGVEIGDGFASVALSGEENADEMRKGRGGKPKFLSNHAGGMLGGISTGQPIVARFAVKPTSSILTPRKTIDLDGNETEIVTKGRHDPCVGIRAVPVGEAMMALRAGGSCAEASRASRQLIRDSRTRDRLRRGCPELPREENARKPEEHQQKRQECEKHQYRRALNESREVRLLAQEERAGRDEQSRAHPPDMPRDALCARYPARQQDV